MIGFFNGFVKVTGWLVQKIIFRTKIYYEDKKVQSRSIKGKAIISSNHTSVYDYAVMLFVFLFRTIRYQMAEVLFKKKGLGLFLKMMGGIYVNRDTHDFSFIYKSEEILNKGGVVGTFPESRIPLPNESRPLEFKTSTAYLAYLTNTNIIPVYTDGVYFKKARARVIIGKPLIISDIVGDKLSEKDNIELINKALRDKIIDLERVLNEQRSQKE